MILPIFAYGQAVLKKVATPISTDYPELEATINNMWETMYNASGVGLAAPQIGLSIRVFIIDTIQIMKETDKHKGIKKVFINAEILEESGEPWLYEEGCLSIPDIRGDVSRKPAIKVKYQNEQFEEILEEYDGINARVIQHEYDHIQGILFTEYFKPLKKKLVSRKLEAIKMGKIASKYRMKFAKLL